MEQTIGLLFQIDFSSAAHGLQNPIAYHIRRDPLKIAVTIWGNRVSPVFDAAKTLLVADIKDSATIRKSYVNFNAGSPETLIRILKQMRVSILVCGAISTHPADLIVENEIKLISFVTGNAMEFLDTFARKQVIEKSYMMPGCSKHYSLHRKSKGEPEQVHGSAHF